MFQLRQSAAPAGGNSTFSFLRISGYPNKKSVLDWGISSAGRILEQYSSLKNIKFSILNIHYLKILNLVFRMLNYFELRTRVFNSGLAFFCDIWTLSQIGSQTRQDFADLRAF